MRAQPLGGSSLPSGSSVPPSCLAPRLLSATLSSRAAAPPSAPQLPAAPAGADVRLVEEWGFLGLNSYQILFTFSISFP